MVSIASSSENNPYQTFDLTAWAKMDEGKKIHIIPPVIDEVYAKQIQISFSNLYNNSSKSDKCGTSNMIESMSFEMTNNATTSSSNSTAAVSVPSGGSSDCRGGGIEKYRDPRNGAMQFKSNTEEDLLMHVQNGLQDQLSNTNYTGVKCANALLSSIDIYCLGKHWMFHVGHEKGVVLSEFLQKCITTFINNEQNTPKTRKFVIVDLGTYCGYSSILFAKTVREFAPTLDFVIYSTEVSDKYIEVATRMIQMSKLQNYMRILKLHDPTKAKNGIELVTSLKDAIGGDAPKIDFVFMDHDKPLYLTDLQALRSNQLIHTGTYVAADNVIYYKELQEYRNYIHHLAEKNIVESCVVEMKLEYTGSNQKINDGIELTIFK